MAKSSPWEGKTTKKGKLGKVGHIKMIIIDDLKAETIISPVKENVCNESSIDSDNSAPNKC